MHYRARFARIAATALVGALLSSLVALAAPAMAFAWTVDTTARTESEMRARWEQLKPTYSGSPYSVAPSLSAPYAPGDAAAGFRADGLNMINFARYLSGLPSDVRLDPAMNAEGQHGAVLLRKLNRLVHVPAPETRPSDMPVAFFDTATAATSTSNLGMGYTDSEGFQKGSLDDSGADNLAAVGHRRWLLDPSLLYTGIGFADNYHTTKVMGFSAAQKRTGLMEYSAIAWPSAGIFPAEFMTSRTPWSVTLNPARYDWAATGFVVTMRRVADGRTWVFDASDTNTAGEYFSANFGGYGVANAFIFRPDPASIRYAPGDQFDITLSGAIYDGGTGQPAAVSYRTSIGALSGAYTEFGSAPGTPAPQPVPAPAPAPGPMPVYRFYNRINGSHFYTASLSERESVIANHAATYAYEGVAYTVNTANAVNSAPLYRFYNRRTGSHFYTASAAEKDSVIARLSGTLTFEGPAYNVSLTPTDVKMYRFYNRINGSHFYTASESERDTVIAALSGTYAFEGVAYYLGR